MMRFWGFLVLLAVVGSAALADESSPARVFDFKGVVIGGPTTLKEIQEKLGVRCVGDWGGAFSYVCNGSTTIAQENAYLNLVVNAQHVVQRIALHFDSRSFEVIERELIRKFGQPVETERHALQNAFGAAFEQVEHRWVGSDGTEVTFQRFAGKFDKSLLYFSTAEDRAILEKSNKDRSKDM